MVMHVYGRKPTGEHSEMFCRNIHGWAELSRYCTSVAPAICSPIRYWLDDSIHEGLDAAGAVALADALQTEIDAGNTAAYAASVHPNDVPKPGRPDIFLAEEGPHPLVKNVTDFVAFLRGSGGFEIC
jgi:hypothetical protein